MSSKNKTNPVFQKTIQDGYIFATELHQMGMDISRITSDEERGEWIKKYSQLSKCKYIILQLQTKDIPDLKVRNKFIEMCQLIDQVYAEVFGKSFVKGRRN